MARDYKGFGNQEMTGVIEHIPCCIDKNGTDGNFCKSGDEKLCDIGTDVCRTITCKELSVSVHHSNMVLEVKK